MPDQGFRQQSNWDPLAGLLDSLNEVGSRVRYGVGPTEKYKLMMSGQVPGQPKPFLPTGDENPDAVRYLSNYLAAQQWGAPVANTVNGFRHLIDKNDTAYQSGLQGAQMGDQGAQLRTLLASLVRR